MSDQVVIQTPFGETFKPPSSDEIEVRGDWIIESGKAIENANAKRIDWLIECHLTKVACSEDGWSILYKDPVDQRLWLLDFPLSETHGGGPKRLTLGSPDDADRLLGGQDPSIWRRW